MRTVLVYHRSSGLDKAVLAPWLASCSELVGIVTLDEPRGQWWLRLRRELRRVGPLRLLDVLAFRVYYAWRLARRDAAWEREAISRYAARYAEVPPAVARLSSASPNSPEVRSFLQETQPDLVLARCKLLIDEEIFSLPRLGTFVLHPGATPEYRNSHGCFWALANRELDKVVVSLVEIDAGIDTGPVYGYFSYEFDERSESHVVIQKRVVLENLDAIGERFCEIGRGEARPIDTTGRASAVWGQPWLSRHLRWKHDAGRRAHAIGLGYHDIVGPDTDESGFKGRAPAHYKLRRSQFERHLAVIGAVAAKPPARAHDLFDLHRRDAWLLTFDDGGASAATVSELLAPRGWPAHFFVTTDRVGESGFLDADGIRKLHALGHVVGSHSCSHPERMSHCTPAELDREWRESVAVLSGIVGEPVTTASVPGGHYARKVAVAAAAAGIRVLFTSEPDVRPHRVDGCLVVGRMAITVKTRPERVAELVVGQRLPLGRARAAWGVRKIAKSVGGPVYIRIRRAILTRRASTYLLDDDDVSELLGIYVDDVYRVVTTGDATTISADRAFLLFAAEVGRAFEGLVLFGRALTAEEHADYVLPKEVKLVPLPYYRDLRQLREVARALAGTTAGMWRGVGQVDVVWVFGPHPFGFLLCVIAALRRKRVVLGIRQDTLAYVRSRMPSSRWALGLAGFAVLELIQRGLSRRLRTTVVGRNLARRYGPRALPMTVSLVRREQLASEPARAAPSEEVRLLTVGRLEQEKNPLLVVRTLALLERRRPGRYRLTWIGRGKLETEVRALAEELDVARLIELRGYVPFGDELLDLYRQADVFVHVSHTEGVPQVLVEALTCATPIVATAVGGVPPALEDGRLGLLVPPDDADALVAAIERLTDDVELRERLTTAGLEAAAELTLEAEAQRVAAYIRGASPG